MPGATFRTTRKLSRTGGLLSSPDLMAAVVLHITTLDTQHSSGILSNTPYILQNMFN